MQEEQLKEKAKGQQKDATIKPVFQEEPAKLKSIIRDIAMHEAKHDDAMIFRVEQRQHLRRLAGLGVLAHQPAMAAFCKTTEEEREKVTLCIPQQKAGSNPKELKNMKKLKEKDRCDRKKKKER